ncbi:hypothetical protein [Rhodopirellula baltica]|uniref:hypothetical protein n=1 Tax=Rhodopirellula baltica TaxID=265606 RepID=UPI0005607537|nr:hypothetical protein [Rhodopirellula baltica]
MPRYRHLFFPIAFVCFLLGCERVPPAPPVDISEYEAQYYLWRGSAEQQLDELSSWIWGDNELRVELGKQTDERHVRFLHIQIQQDMHCAALLAKTQLGSDELREAVNQSSSPVQTQVLWVKWFAERDPDGVSHPITRSPTDRLIISRIDEGRRRYQGNR